MSSVLNLVLKHYINIHYFMSEIHLKVVTMSIERTDLRVFFEQNASSFILIACAFSKFGLCLMDYTYSIFLQLYCRVRNFLDFYSTYYLSV
jgi:hypothetical protein